MIPPLTVNPTFSRMMACPAYGVMSMSTEAITDGLLGVLFGFAYRTRTLKAGYILSPRFDMFFRGRKRSCTTRLAGMTRDTRSVESRGLTPFSAGSLAKASNMLYPSGTRLGRYSLSTTFASTCSAGLRFAAAENTTEGFWSLTRPGRLSSTDNLHSTRTCASSVSSPSPGL